jgi:beta-xylosidase
MHLPRYLIVTLLCCGSLTNANVVHAAEEHSEPAFRPGTIWTDTSGRPIQAHGGGILWQDGVYYWYGENKDGPTLNNNRVDIIGISCYSSRDLYHWEYQGLALQAVPEDPEHDLHPSRVCERPKVIFNEKTRKYVMWVHIDDAKYQYARTGVAVADQPTGPFRYLESFRPNGSESRDMTLFKDEDGQAYVIFGTGWHTHVQIADLTADYLKPSGVFSNHFPRPGPPTGREAPAIFKRKGRYYLITSGTTGWACNDALYAVADSIHGPWTEKGNPCVGPNAEKTFFAQSTFVIPVVGRRDAYIFMADRWNSSDLRTSRYVWLPVEFTVDGIQLRWRDTWDLSIFDRTR